MAKKASGFQGTNAPDYVADKSDRRAPKGERRVLKVGPGGRVVIPAEFRREMALEEGDSIVAFLDDGVLTLYSTEASVRLAQAFVRKFVPEGVSLVDELIEDRRREAEAESRDD